MLERYSEYQTLEKVIVNFQVGDFLRFIPRGEKHVFYCVVTERLEQESQAKVYWVIPAPESESFIQAVDFKNSWDGKFERANQ